MPLDNDADALGDTDHGNSVRGPSSEVDMYSCEGTQNGNATLLKVPVEVLKHICALLEPIWLLNLSYTCTTLHAVLSFEYGNKVWYDVMPPSMWKDPEQFQDETELSRIMDLQGSTHGIGTDLIQQPFAFGRQQQKSPVPTPVNLSTRTTSSLGPVARLAPLPRVYYDISPVPFIASLQPLQNLAMTVKPRKPILALGGPYVRLCNYKREIVGNLNSMKRCYICLNSKGSDGKSVNIWCWGMLLCRECYREYTLTISALRIMPTILPAVYFVDNDGHRIKNATTEIYFKPAIDNVLRIYTALDFQTNFLVFKRYQQEEEKDRLESSRLEANRRIVRQWIVAAAEQMWEGIDPWPAPTMCGDTGEFLGWHQRAWMPTKASFKAFRDRFAPTRMLKHFLFPDYALCDTPSQLPYNAATGWMQDPTMSLKKRDDFDERVTVAWICDNALKMLILLTDCHHPEYHRKGRGGYVSNWLEAAKTWHLARLEIELEYGATVRVDYTPNGLAGLRRCWRIHKLRVKLGMQLESSDGMDPLPQRSVRGIEVSSEAYEEFSRLDRLATDAEQKRAEGIKHFNKIIRHACVACPATSYLIYPMGFEGMLEHLRMGHTELYFESDDFHALG